MLGERFTKEIYSSDFALQYALAARGWTIMPWEEAAQMHNSKASSCAWGKGGPDMEVLHVVRTQDLKTTGFDIRCINNYKQLGKSGSSMFLRNTRIHVVTLFATGRRFFKEGSGHPRSSFS